MIAEVIVVRQYNAIDFASDNPTAAIVLLFVIVGVGLGAKLCGLVK